MPDPSVAGSVDPSVVDVPVLIVGGGPAGLTAALELSRRGISGLLIERRDFTSHFPRAHLLNVRTMETFADVGVAEQIYAESPHEDEWHKVAWYTSLSGPTSLHGLKIGEVPAWGGGLDRPLYASASPCRYANLPQLRIDTILWEHADQAWPGRVLAQHELVDLTYAEDHATATVLDRVNDRTFEVRARYVIGADGGRTCSDLLGVEMAGPRGLVDNVSVHISADLSEFAEPDALLTYFVSPSGHGSFAGAMLALGPGPWGGRSAQWTVGITHRLSEPAVSDEDRVDQILQMLGLPDLDVTVHAISHWQFEGVVAERFRVGPVFLVGDAAHRHPPTGGLGLNTAIGDVSNLAWKIAAVLSGEASEALLDTYEVERMPVAARNIEHSLRNANRHAPVAASMGLVAGQTDEQGWAEIAIWAGDTAEGQRRRQETAKAVAATAEDYSQLNIEAGFAYEAGAVIGDGTTAPAGHDSATAFVPTARPGHHVPHVWLERDGRQVSTSDLVEPTGMTLFVDHDTAPAWSAAAEGCLPNVTVVAVGDALADPSGGWEQVRGTGSSGAVLVRPDRHVAWRATDHSQASVSALQEVLDRVLRPESVVPVDRSYLDGITSAGEALRSGRVRTPQLFTAG